MSNKLFHNQTTTNMRVIKNIYIPFVEKHHTAEFISNVFRKNNIAEVSQVYLLPYYDSNKYNRAFIGIKSWFDTEVAYNFIKKLKSRNLEARIIYQDDNWWTVQANKLPNKIQKTPHKRVFIKKLTHFVPVNVEKTQKLTGIVDDLKLNSDFDGYLREIDYHRQ